MFQDFPPCPLAELERDISARRCAPADPLPCDRWIARSVLQKAIRRGEPELAVRALANLYAHDTRAVWRHLMVIAWEDVGVAHIGLLRCICAAQERRCWRANVGGDWPVLSELVRQAATSAHCQAACDLLLLSINSPESEVSRQKAVEMTVQELATVALDNGASVTHKAVAILAIAGVLTSAQTNRDPASALAVVAEATGMQFDWETRRVWTVTRNPMALLLPLVARTWSNTETHRIESDPMPPVQLTSAVPGYALDQFTRGGKAIARELLASNADLGTLFDRARVPSSERASAIGDILFLREGGLLRDRLIWPLADQLARPHRWLPAVAVLGSYMDEAIRLLDAKARQVAILRADHLSIATRAKAI